MSKRRTAFVAVFFFLMLLASVLTFAMPAKAFSENENRVLASAPKLSFKNIKSGKFQEDLSDFLSDQVPLREAWIKVNTDLKKCAGKREINGVYLADDKYYVQKFTDESYSRSSMLSVFSMINEFADENKDSFKTTVMLAPTPGTVLKDRLPFDAPFYDDSRVFGAAEQMIPAAKFVDLRKTLINASDKKDSQLYYRTDHHWTGDGAALAYKKFAKSQGFKPSEYTLEKVTDEFYGTTYSKILDTSAKPDSIYAPKIDRKLKVVYGDGKKVNSLYDKSALNKKDKYEYFFGGNFDKVTINTGVKNDKRILLIKDSFANSFVPFIVNDYSKIVMVDLRFFDGDLRELCKKEDITDVLFLYETSNLLTDKGILKLANSID